MKNGDILKCFFNEKDIDEIICELEGPFCPNKDFQERYNPCSNFSCVECWRKFIELDDGLELGISAQEDGDAE